MSMVFLSSLRTNDARDYTDAASTWEGGNGGWALRAIMDLVEGGDVRRLFSDEELLTFVAAEEEHERRAMVGTHEQDTLGKLNHTSREPVETTGDGERRFPAEEAPALGGVPGSSTASKDEVCNT